MLSFEGKTYCNLQIQIYCMSRQLELSLLCWLKASLQWMQYMYPKVPGSLAQYASSMQLICHLQNFGCNQTSATCIKEFLWCTGCFVGSPGEGRWIWWHIVPKLHCLWHKSCHRHLRGLFKMDLRSSVLIMQIHCLNKRPLFPLCNLSYVPLAAAFYLDVR